MDFFTYWCKYYQVISKKILQKDKSLPDWKNSSRLLLYLEKEKSNEVKEKGETTMS